MAKLTNHLTDDTISLPTHQELSANDIAAFGITSQRNLGRDRRTKKETDD